jgi:hypothetical protein
MSSFHISVAAWETLKRKAKDQKKKLSRVSYDCPTVFIKRREPNPNLKKLRTPVSPARDFFLNQTCKSAQTRNQTIIS